MRWMCSVVALSAAVSAAHADTVITFGFTDMAGTYTSASGQFDVLVDLAFGTSGDVSLGPGLGTAEYHPGFGAPADTSFSMSISNLTATTGDGVGSFLITDADGDTIGGVLDGVWTDRGNGFSYFDGTLTGVMVSDNGVADGSFDGPGGVALGLAGVGLVALGRRR